MYRRLWVRIPATYTGWTFFTFICCKKCNICLKRRKQAGSGYWKNYLLLVHHNTKVRIHFQWSIPLHGGRQCHDSPQKDTAWICSRRRSCATPYLCVSSFRLEQVQKVFFPIRKMSASFRCKNYEAKKENIYFIKWANPGLFFVYFWSFQANNNTFLQQINVKKCHVHQVYGIGIRTNDKEENIYSFLTSDNFFPKDFPLLTSSSTKTPGQCDQIWRNLAKVANFLSLWPNILRVYLLQRFELT